MIILVTGAGGFIGSNTVDFLTSRNHKVIAVDNFSTGRVENLSKLDGDLVKVVDIRDMTLMNMIFEQYRPEAVLHLAAQSAITKAWKSPQEDLSVNALGTLHLLELSLRYGVGKFVFSSTSAVYGKGGYFASTEKDKLNPDTPYGISKMTAENYIRLLFPEHVILRYANVYGPRQEPIGQNQVVARVFRHFIHGDDFHVFGDGNQKRDFVYVDDVCYANYLALVENQFGTFNVPAGKSVSVNDMLTEIEKIYGILGYVWSHTDDQDERGNVHLNASLIRNKLGWRARTSLSDGLRLTALDWESR